MINESTNLLKCRKCGGPHFTIKCGKEKIVEKTETVDKTVVEPKKYYNDFEHKNDKNFSRKIYRIKLSELPIDMTDEEMMEMTSEWGHISKIKVLNYNMSSVAYIDFKFEDEAKYFIEAIDKTPLNSLLLSAIIVNSY